MKTPLPSAQPASKGEMWFHVPFPGDHYSPATGSAAMAVIYELNRQHERNGGQTQVVVGRGTRHDYPVGHCVEVDYPISPNPRQKAVDAMLGRLRFPRQIEAAIYRPASRAIRSDFDGPIFIINAPGALPLFKAQHGRSQICLHAVNALFRTYKRAEVRHTLERADHVICCSQFIANDLEMRLGAASNKIEVVHNGVDVQKFVPATSQNETEVPTILFVGRAVPEKGPDLLLRAACKIHQRHGARRRKLKVRIVGSAGFAAKARLSPYEEELRRIAEPLGENVEFQASVDREQLLREYQGASIFCAPSNWDDPFPLTVLEAMSCGLPVVASRRGGIPESGGEDILYFQPPDVDELAAHLAALLDSAELRSDWGARARRRVQRFTWENQYRRLRHVLHMPPIGTPTESESAVSETSKNCGLGIVGWMALTGWMI